MFIQKEKKGNNKKIKERGKIKAKENVFGCKGKGK